jgi:hypothetical protein
LIEKCRDHQDPVSAVATLLPMFPIRHTMIIRSVPPSQSRLVTDRILKSNHTEFLFQRSQGNNHATAAAGLSPVLASCAARQHLTIIISIDYLWRASDLIQLTNLSLSVWALLDNFDSGRVQYSLSNQKTKYISSQ